MKRILTTLLLFSLLFTACGASGAEQAAAETVTCRIAGLKGPTSMGLVSLMDKVEKGEAEGSYEFSLYAAADEITPKLIQGELDMAALPANLASVLYNNTEGQIEVLAVNTLGVLYIAETGSEISTLSDLKGKTVYATGKGSTPEYTLRTLLSACGIDPDKDLTLDFRSEPAEVVSLLTAGQAEIVMLPQPYLTVAQTKVENLRVAVDLTKAWDEEFPEGHLITGVMAVRSEFLSSHPETVQVFLKEYEASVNSVLADTDTAAELCEHFDITKAAVAKKALPYCNITFLSGAEMRTSLEKYLTTLYEQNPKAVGGKMPGEDFYYTGN